jgi:hypothetical protein
MLYVTADEGTKEHSVIFEYMIFVEIQLAHACFILISSHRSDPL